MITVCLFALVYSVDFFFFVWGGGGGGGGPDKTLFQHYLTLMLIL